MADPVRGGDPPPPRIHLLSQHELNPPLQPSLYKETHNEDCVIIFASANDLYQGKCSNFQKKVQFSVEALNSDKTI